MKPEQPMAPVQNGAVQIAHRADFRRDRYATGRAGLRPVARLCRRERQADIRVIINSPGGHVESGDTIHDMIRFCGRGEGDRHRLGGQRRRHIFLAPKRKTASACPTPAFCCTSRPAACAARPRTSHRGRGDHQDARPHEPDDRRRPASLSSGSSRTPSGISGSGPTPPWHMDWLRALSARSEEI